MESGNVVSKEIVRRALEMAENDQDPHSDPEVRTFWREFYFWYDKTPNGKKEREECEDIYDTRFREIGILASDSPHFRNHSDEDQERMRQLFREYVAKTT